TMAELWQALRLRLVVLLTLMALTYQARKKTFLSVHEVTATEDYAKDSLQWITDQYNKESDDKYHFRIFRVLKIQKRITDHMEYHLNVEMQRTTCQKPETTNCVPQEGELYKQVNCFFSVFANPWFEQYKILNKNCSSD
uniref:Cystatin-11 n=2 Tax=Cebus imitator TaxID=2715852 RepID=A0A2K5S5P9_CEBIM